MTINTLPEFAVDVRSLSTEDRLSMAMQLDTLLGTDREWLREGLITFDPEDYWIVYETTGYDDGSMGIYRTNMEPEHIPILSSEHICDVLNEALRKGVI